MRKKMRKKDFISIVELDQLNSLEQHKLFGGFYGEDVDNNNTTSGCICGSKNKTNHNNSNSAENCKCLCY